MQRENVFDKYGQMKSTSMKYVVYKILSYFSLCYIYSLWLNVKWNVIPNSKFEPDVLAKLKDLYKEAR